MQADTPDSVTFARSGPAGVRTVSALVSGSLSLSFSEQSFVWDATLNGNLVVTLVDGPASMSRDATLIITQDTVGGRTLQFANATVASGFHYGTLAGSVTVVRCLWDGMKWTVLNVSDVSEDWSVTYGAQAANSSNLNRLRAVGKRVNLTFDVSRSSGTWSASEHLLTVPAWLSPAGAVFGAGRVVTSSDSTEVAPFVVLTNGRVELRASAAGSKSFGASVSWDLT